MSSLLFFQGTRDACRTLAVLLLLSVSFVNQATAADKVTTYKDENGWKLQVNGSDFYVKGVVWGYTPRKRELQLQPVGPV